LCFFRHRYVFHKMLPSLFHLELIARRGVAVTAFWWKGLPAGLKLSVVAKNRAGEQHADGGIVKALVDTFTASTRRLDT
jgi:hypothetical protein